MYNLVAVAGVDVNDMDITVLYLVPSGVDPRIVRDYPFIADQKYYSIPEHMTKDRVIDTTRVILNDDDLDYEIRTVYYTTDNVDWNVDEV